MLNKISNAPVSLAATGDHTAVRSQNPSKHQRKKWVNALERTGLKIPGDLNADRLQACFASRCLTETIGEQCYPELFTAPEIHHGKLIIVIEGHGAATRSALPANPATLAAHESCGCADCAESAKPEPPASRAALEDLVHVNQNGPTPKPTPALFRSRERSALSRLLNLSIK